MGWAIATLDTRSLSQTPLQSPTPRSRAWTRRAQSAWHLAATLMTAKDGSSGPPFAPNAGGKVGDPGDGERDKSKQRVSERAHPQIDGEDSE